MKNPIRLICTLFLSLSFWLASNQCAFESLAHADSTHSSPSDDHHSQSASHDGHNHEHGKVPQNDSDDSCCQSIHALPATSSFAIMGSAGKVSARPLAIAFFASFIQEWGLTDDTEIASTALDPPPKISQSASLISLALCPNAPPPSSSYC